MSKSREQLNQLLKNINIQGKHVLDVGVQDKPTRRLTQGNPATYWTMDIDDQWSPQICGDLNKPWSTWKWNVVVSNPRRQKFIPFDVIFCIEVLEHCWNPVACVQNLYELLKPNGVAYISTPFINPHHDYVDYLRYTGEWYGKVLHEVGFKDVVIAERVATTGKGLLQGFFQAEGLRVSKIRPEYGRYTYPIGYFVEARK